MKTKEVRSEQMVKDTVLYSCTKNKNIIFSSHLSSVRLIGANIMN